MGEFNDTVHRDDLSNEELIKYLKKKGLSFGSLKVLVEQALDNNPQTKSTQDRKKRDKKKNRFPPIQDCRTEHRKKQKKKRKDGKKSRKREDKAREKDEDREFMNAIEKILPKEKHDKVASYFTKGKTA